MKQNRIIILLLAIALLGSCATKKPVTRAKWQTAQAMNCLATVVMDSSSYTVGCSMHVIRDSLILFSVKPIAAIEVGRLEITPQQATVIDKINHQYTTFPLSKTMSVVPKIRWADLQTFASGERAQKGDKVSLAYSWQGHAVRLDLTYGDLIYDAPMNNKRLNTDRYKYIDIATYLRQ